MLRGIIIIIERRSLRFPGERLKIGIVFQFYYFINRVFIGGRLLLRSIGMRNGTPWPKGQGVLSGAPASQECLCFATGAIHPQT
jgi:hypothetical protein